MDFYRDRTVLVTGGLGFIGSNLSIELVRCGARVRIVDPLLPELGGNLFNIEPVQDQVQLLRGDLRDPDAAARAVEGADVIFNLAGQISHIDSMTDPYQDLEINCRSHLTLLEACRRHNRRARVVYSSSRQLYGRPRYLPVDEMHPVDPVDVNGCHELAAEQYHFVYRKAYGVPVVSLRLTNTYGPRQLLRHSRQGFLGWFVRQALDGAEISVYGDGRQLRDPAFVDDVVEALLLAGSKPEADGEIFNLGGPAALSLQEIADTLLRIAGRGTLRLAPFPPEKQAIDIGSYYACWAKIHDRLGWRPKVGLEEGFRRTLDFYGPIFSHYV
ncbi:MAG: NAD-dependent epimerase/dehydratase family protein [Acidobacteria bacterium]|nr:NAD-dependent epimerase/dehydratase family protein [Acidobacteriota bacterium]